LNKKIIRFKKFTLTATLATYLLIFIGGLVRVSGAGLGCPDWPKCFGRWIPPFNSSQIPPEFNAASFNFTLAWIEYINRLAGMLTGILILITAILAIKNFRNRKKIMVPSVLAAVVVAFQGWYGSIVVQSDLQPVTISIHLLLALFIVSLLLYTLINVHFLDQSPAGKQIKPAGNILRILWLASLIQITLGTEIRSAVEQAWQKFPLLSASEILSHTGPVTLVHAMLGILVAAGTVMISIRILRITNGERFVRQGIAILNLLILTQLLIGFAMQIFGILPFLQIFHLWSAALFIGIILVLYTSLSYQWERP
jgi:cytochrome c oxidase assembly protein subunit 15